MQVDSKRRNSIQEDIQPQIILQVVNNVWSVNILLDDVAGSLVKTHRFFLGFLVEANIKNMVHIPRQKDAFALWKTIRLNNEGNLSFVVLILLVKVAQIKWFTRQHPSLRVKLEFLGVAFLETAQITS